MYLVSVDPMDRSEVYLYYKNDKPVWSYNSYHIIGQSNSKLILPVVGQSTSSTPGLQQSEVQSVDVSSGAGHSVG